MASAVVDGFFFPFILRGKAEADTLSQQPMPHQAAGEGANARVGPIAMRSSRAGPE